MTVANLDCCHGVPLDEIAGTFTDCLRRVGPVVLGLRGLAISRSTVFAQVHVRPVATLFRLRAAVHRSLIRDAPDIPKSPVDVVGFCNAVRFRQQDISAARAIVARSRDIDFGRFQIDEIEIVRTDKVLSAANTIVLAKCARRSP